MSRILATAVGLLGLLQFPLGLSAGTSWLIPAAHLLLCTLAAPLSLMAGMRGRPGEAVGWGLWVVVATAGGMVAIHATNWTQGGWSWWLPYMSSLTWGWVPVATAVVGARMGEGVRWRRARAAVRSRHRAGAVVDAVLDAARRDPLRPASAGGLSHADQNSVG